MFSIRSTSSSRELVLSNRNGEYFRAELVGDVSAAVDVWAYTDAKGLCELFQELATFDKPWQGEKAWSSIEEEFQMSVSCSALGDVLFKIQLCGLRGAPEEWRVGVGLATEFGQLPMIAKRANEFFA